MGAETSRQSQVITNQCSFVPTRPLAREVRVPWREAEGPCFARHLAQQLYRGEQYVLQVDAHMRCVVSPQKGIHAPLSPAGALITPALTTIPRFVEGWDDLCLEQLDLAEQALGQIPSDPLVPPKAVLSTYPQDYCGGGSATELPECRVVPLLCAGSFGDDGEHSSTCSRRSPLGYRLARVRLIPPSTRSVKARVPQPSLAGPPPYPIAVLGCRVLLQQGRDEGRGEPGRAWGALILTPEVSRVALGAHSHSLQR